MDSFATSREGDKMWIPIGLLLGENVRFREIKKVGDDEWLDIDFTSFGLETLSKLVAQASSALAQAEAERVTVRYPVARNSEAVA